MALTDGLVLALRFDNTLWYDDSGNAYDPTPHGAVLPSVLGGGVVLNGSDQYFSVPSNSRLQGGNKDFSAFARFSLSSVAATAYVFGKFGEYGLYYDQPNNQFRFSTGGDVVLLSGVTPTVGVIYNLICRFKYLASPSSRASIAQAGICISSESFFTASGATTGNDLEIGRFNAANYFPGTLYTLAIWDRLLDYDELTTECVALYNSGAGWEPDAITRPQIGAFDECGEYLGLREVDIRLFDSMNPATGRRKSVG